MSTDLTAIRAALASLDSLVTQYAKECVPSNTPAVLPPQNVDARETPRCGEVITTTFWGSWVGLDTDIPEDTVTARETTTADMVRMDKTALWDARKYAAYWCEKEGACATGSCRGTVHDLSNLAYETRLEDVVDPNDPDLGEVKDRRLAGRSKIRFTVVCTCG